MLVFGPKLSQVARLWQSEIGGAMLTYPSGIDLKPGDLSGTWAALDGTLVYREVPKAACSTLGQVLFHADHGTFFAGDIHDATSGVVRWPFDRTNITAQSFVFSAVRNPYARILSTFLEKVCTDQRDGKPYRNTLRQLLAERYGVDMAGDPVRAFRRFLLFVRDVMVHRDRFWFDRHWTPQVQHLRALPLNGVDYTYLFAIEGMTQGLAPILAPILDRIPATTRPAQVPRFNTGPKPTLPLVAWFDDLSIHMMQEIYRWDFELLGYDRFDPDQSRPLAALDAAVISARLRDPHAPHWAPLSV